MWRGGLLGGVLVVAMGCGTGPGSSLDPQVTDPYSGAPVFDWPSAWAERETEMLELVNAARDAGTSCPSGPQPAAPALVLDTDLQAAARGHAWDMAVNGYFDHDGLDGRDPFDRMVDAGFSGSPAAENIAAGNAAAEDTLTQWLSSTDGHCENIMDPELTTLGVGYAEDQGAPYRHYWVQNFGR